MSLKSINPYTLESIAEFDEFTDEKVRDILIKSADAFEKWRKTTFPERRSQIEKVARLLRQQTDVYARTITAEMGKPIRESIAEVEKCAWVCEFYAVNAESFLAPYEIKTDADSSYVYFEPLGTILGIMPWNFPFWQAFRFVVPTLMAGNTVVLKHASNVQMCARHIENIFTESGLPSYVFSNLVVGSKKVSHIIENDIVKAVSLTGSEHAGQQVAENAGRKIKKTLLELGGSNSFVVLDDADLEQAAEIGVRARMQNGGQSCIAAKRFIVTEKISDQFISLFHDKIRNLIPGDPANMETLLGPLSSLDQAEAVRKQVETSVSKGARIIAGGYPEKTLYPPTIILDVKPGMPVFDEEVFGPVAPVTVAKDDMEAVWLANKSRYGLGVSLFTNDRKKAFDLIPEFSDGAVFINALVKSDPRLPFGGTKSSGYGRELSEQGIREFVNIKTVYYKDINTLKNE